MVRYAKRLSRARAAAFAAVLWVAITSPASASGQPARPQATAAEARMLLVAREIMRAARFGTFITRDHTGATSARTVDPILPDSSFVIRFATNPRSRKVREIARERRVTLFYFDAATLGYVSLSGTARVLIDSAAKSRHWKKDWEPFYPDRERDVVIIEVIPTRLEVVSVKEGITGDSVTWAAPAVRNFRRPRGDRR